MLTKVVSVASPAAAYMAGKFQKQLILRFKEVKQHRFVLFSLKSGKNFKKLPTSCNHLHKSTFCLFKSDFKV